VLQQSGSGGVRDIELLPGRVEMTLWGRLFTMGTGRAAAAFRATAAQAAETAHEDAIFGKPFGNSAEHTGVVAAALVEPGTRRKQQQQQQQEDECDPARGGSMHC